MLNPYQTKKVVIKKVIKESADVKRYILELVDKAEQESFDFMPGQFIEVSIPGYNEAPFTFGSSPKNKDYFEIAVRNVGQLTEALNKMKEGDAIGIRGSFGNGFDLDLIKQRNILMVSGGCGFVPLKSIIEDYLIDKNNYKGKFQVFYGARSYDDLLFKEEFNKWRVDGIDLNLTIDKNIKCDVSNLNCNIGLVTELFKKIKVVEKPVILMCGPPVMVKFVILECDKLKIPHSDIFVSLERRMECGVGVCEHCAVGPYYVCKDGPVFGWDKIERIPGVI